MKPTSTPGLAGFVVSGVMLILPAELVPQTCTTTVPEGTVVNETWTPAGSPHCVTGDIGVSLLTIEPGVEVLVDGPYQIQVLSTIVAVGTSDFPVVFTAKDTAVPWKGLKFQSTPPGSRLSNCIVEYSDDSGITVINSAPDVEDCTISNNTAQSGAGMRIVLDGDPGLTFEVKRSRIINNASTLGSNACNGTGNGTGAGGGVHAVATTGMLILRGCEITGNTSGTPGARGTRSGSGLFVEGSAQISGCLINDNETFTYDCPCVPAAITRRARGGGIYGSGVLTVDTTIIRNNLVQANVCFTGSGIASGSGIYLADGVLTLENSVVSDNRSEGNGPGNTAASRGSIFVNEGTADLVNSSVALNDKAGLRNENGSFDVINAILFFNDNNGEQISGTVTATYSDVQGGFPGVGNIDFNPAFGSGYDLKIVKGSPAIDSGNPESMYDDACFPPSLGTTRNDMGAHGGPGACVWTLIFTDGFESGDTSAWSNTVP